MKKQYHYTYYSYEEWGRGYIGKRSCFCHPKEDVNYLGSFKDKTFKPTKKVILNIFETKEEALKAEIILHDFYNVDVNLHFANRSKQKTVKFHYSAPKDKNCKYKKRDWHHKRYGNFYGLSVTDLMEKFKEQNLNQGHLSEVALGSRNNHRGWTSLNSKRKYRGSQRNWFHPEHGIYLNISNRKLCSLFQGRNYYHNMLSRVIKGKIDSHNGWVLYHTVMTKEELLNI